ncbi:MAG: hypothetical protein ACYC6W_11835 [Nitrosotalea sp.]
MKFLPGFGVGYDGQVSQRDIDQYDLVAVDNPTVSSTWFGSVSNAANGTLVIVNVLPDWPRNLAYIATGTASGTYGGTVVAKFFDQFGSAVTETVAIASAVNGGTVFGSAICGKFVSGSYAIVSTGTASTGTVSIGVGTLSNGSAQSNWFGLLSKVAGTSDVKNIVWVNSTTATALNGGTSIGSLVNTTLHAFQGTSGVAATDHYKVIFKPSFDNSALGTMSAL